MARLVRGAAGTLTGKERGADRAVRRDSYDVEDPRAKPWKPLGTIGEGLAHQDALIQTAEEQRLQQWRDNPRRKVREARDGRAVIAAELAAIDAGAESAAGHAANLRIELSKFDQIIEVARAALRRIDVEILRALIVRVDFATGRLFPAIETIAADAGCHRNSVVGALRRLRLHGFIDWVRRSIATGNEGEFGPQREQTSNAYFFDHRQKMQKRTWQRFIQVLTAKLKRLGKIPPALRQPPPSAPPRDDPNGLHQALSALGALVPNAST
ncbi:MAG: helix-turn-helix domain-containing protein [Pseudomonadota bacterium]|nr:helix-turn-helix domain-containing protein [Pseudomonadota bacterium]